MRHVCAYSNYLRTSEDEDGETDTRQLHEAGGSAQSATGACEGDEERKSGCIGERSHSSAGSKSFEKREERAEDVGLYKKETHPGI
jgi:hypothetical protein